MTYGQLAVAGSFALLALGTWLAIESMNGMAALPWWMAAPLPTLVAYGLCAEHTDRSIFDRWRDADAGGLGDLLDRQLREVVPGADPFDPPAPEPFVPGADPWPSPTDQP